MLLLHAGRECTHTFESYHPFSDKASQILRKYEIGYVVGKSEFPSYLPDSGFYRECKKRVTAYFVENKVNPKDCRPGMARMSAVFLIRLASYFLMNGFFTSNIFVLLAFSVLHGFCDAFMLMHLVHVTIERTLY